mgnify:CR=1 FL=1
MGAEAFIEGLLSKYPPGAYFFRGLDVEGVTGVYFKSEKAGFISMLAHDYILAVLRGDSAARNKVREAYRVLASWFDWDKPPWRGLEEALEASGWSLKAARDEVVRLAEEASAFLFKVYEREVRIEGWRAKPDETVYEGGKRLAGRSREDVKLYLAEESRWHELAERLRGMLWKDELRLGDKASFWLAKSLLSRVRRYTIGYRGNRMAELLEKRALEDIIEPCLDEWSSLSLLYIDEAFRRIDDVAHMEEEADWKNTPLGVGDLIIMAAMAAEGVDPREYAKSGRLLAKMDEYLADFARRRDDPELLTLYDAATRIPQKFAYRLLLLLYTDYQPTEEEKKALASMRDAEETFVSYMLQYIAEILKERERKIREKES